MNIEEGVIKAKAILDNHNEIDKMMVIEMVELVETLLTAYEKEKEKNKSLEQENSFLKMLYRGADEFKAIEKLVKEE